MIFNILIMWGKQTKKYIVLSLKTFYKYILEKANLQHTNVIHADALTLSLNLAELRYI